MHRCWWGGAIGCGDSDGWGSLLRPLPSDTTQRINGHFYTHRHTLNIVVTYLLNLLSRHLLTFKSRTTVLIDIMMSMTVLPSTGYVSRNEPRMEQNRWNRPTLK